MIKTRSSSAYSTFSNSSTSAVPQGRRFDYLNFDLLAVNNSRPAFFRTKSCDLIVSGKGIVPAVKLPPSPHLREKFTTLPALGRKPTTKPVPFKFPASTMTRDGCRRYLAKKQRYCKQYEETFEDVIAQHARVANNLDKLAVRVRKIFNPSVNFLYNTNASDRGCWDLSELVKHADVLQKNLDVSSKILNELIDCQNMEVDRLFDSSLTRPQPIKLPMLQYKDTSDKSRMAKNQPTVHVIGSHLMERQQLSLKSFKHSYGDSTNSKD